MRAPYLASFSAPEPVSAPEVPVDPVHDPSPRPVVVCDMSGSSDIDTEHTPLAGAPHTDAGPAAEGADNPGESTASQEYDWQSTGLQSEVPKEVPETGSGPDMSAYDTPLETAETAENCISGAPRLSLPASTSRTPKGTNHVAICRRRTARKGSG